jgi:phosphopantetheinyl transferase
VTRVRVDLVTTTTAPSRPEMLEPQEFRRWVQLRYLADRDRLFTGVMLRRAVLGEKAQRPVPVQRGCRGCGAVDHGEVQPELHGDRTRWRTSLSHSQTEIVLAVAEAEGADLHIGVDLESIARMDPRMTKHILSPAERSRIPNPTRRLLCGIWTAKEATLKALGCGLHASMLDLEIKWSPQARRSVVHPVGADPRLNALREQRSRLFDVTGGISDGHDDETGRRAALMVIGAEDVRIVHRRLTTNELWAATS